MKKTLYCCLFIIWIIASCDKKETPLTGHWVSKEYFQGKPFTTIDFYTEKGYDFYTGKEKDTLECYILFNKNSLAFSSSGSMAKEKNGNNFFFLIGHNTIDTLSFKNDSIYIWGEYYPGIFAKVKESETLPDELFIGSELAIKLPECQGAYLAVNDSIFTMNFNIGFNKEISDSIFINYQDIYARISDIPKIIKEEKDVRITALITGGKELMKKDKIRLHLNSDRKVPDSFLNKIIAFARKGDPNLKIFKASFDYKNKKLCYKLLQD